MTYKTAVLNSAGYMEDGILIGRKSMGWWDALFLDQELIYRYSYCYCSSGVARVLRAPIEKHIMMVP